MSKPTISNILKASPADLVWLRDHRCQEHGHRYLSHFSCFLKDEGIEEKVGFMDIECSNLQPGFGIVLTWAIMDRKSKNVTCGVITKKELFSSDEDKKLIARGITEMRRYDRLVLHYGRNTKFDIPFLRTRAIMHGLDFPKPKEIWITDTHDICKQVLKVHSRRQNVIAETLFGETIKTRIDHKCWRKALQGDPDSLKYIVDHNIKDVKELARIYEAMVPYYRVSHSSI